MKTIDTFYTSSDGSLTTPQPLAYGKGYSLVEVQAPYGYVLNSKPISFDVTKENSKQKDSVPVIEVTREDVAQKGKITITKTGEAFSTVNEAKGIISRFTQSRDCRERRLKSSPPRTLSRRTERPAQRRAIRWTP